MLDVDSCSVFGEVSTVYDDVLDDKAAVVARFPERSVVDTWTGVSTLDATSLLSDQSQKITLEHSIGEPVKCLNVTIQKTTAYTGSFHDLYKVWINGTLATASPQHDGSFVLPAFDTRFTPTTPDGNTNDSTVTPVAISLLVERDARPPDAVFVTSRQRYTIVADAETVVEERTNDKGRVELQPTLAESVSGRCVIAPYPAMFTREPYFVITDVRPLRQRIRNFYGGLITSVVVVAIIVASGIGVAQLGIIAPVASTLGTFLSRFGRYARVIQNIATVLRAGPSETIMEFWNVINSFLSMVGITDILTVMRSEGISSLAPTAMFDAIRLLLVNFVAGKPKKARSFEFTMQEIIAILDSIRVGGSATDFKSKVLAHWIVSRDEDSASFHGKVTWLIRKVGNGINWLLGIFNFNHPFPSTIDIDTKTGFSKASLFRASLRYEIVISIVDTSLCGSGNSSNIVLTSRQNEAVAAGLYSTGVRNDVRLLEESIDSLRRRIAEIINRGLIDDAVFNGLFGKEPGGRGVGGGLWAFAGAVSGAGAGFAGGGVPGAVAGAVAGSTVGTADWFTSFFAGIKSITTQRFYDGLVNLKQQTVESPDVAAFLAAMRSRRTYSVFKRLGSAVTCRLLPHVLATSGILRADTFEPANADVIFDGDDDEDSVTRAGEGALVGVSYKDFKFVYQSSRRGTRSTNMATELVARMAQSGPTRPVIVQLWTGVRVEYIKRTAVATVVDRRIGLSASYSPFACSFPDDVVCKLVENDATRSRRSQTTEAMVLQPDDNFLSSPAALEAVIAFADLVVEAQLDRASLPPSFAIQFSVASIVDKRVDLVEQLEKAVRGVRMNGARQILYNTDPVFLAFPGGRDLFRLLDRLGAIKQRDTRPPQGGNSPNGSQP
ncbi:hypothetical protein N9S30_00210, partial [bacterium]|nr:hypothetical protein [bacterium]